MKAKKTLQSLAIFALVLCFVFSPLSEAFAYTRDCTHGTCHFFNVPAGTHHVLTFTYQYSQYNQLWGDIYGSDGSTIKFDFYKAGTSTKVLTHSKKKTGVDTHFVWDLSKDPLVSGQSYDLKVTVNGSSSDFHISYYN